MAIHDIARLEEKIDRVQAGAIAVNDSVGGICFTSMSELLEFSKLLAVAGTAIPKHLRGNPGGCLAVTIQALEWRMSPIAVANKSYEVNDRIAYESQLIHAVIEARADLKGRLRAEYKGDGAERCCIVTGHIRGEVDPLSYESPPVGKIKVKNSPLWSADVDQQLWYYATRAWARRYCPDVLLGIYSEDELKDAPELGLATPDVGKRLKKKDGARGFDHEGVERALEHKPTVPFDAGASKPEPIAVASTPAELREESQMELSAGDVETEIVQKKRALSNVETKAEFDAIVTGATEFLKQHKRTDLLADFLSFAKERGKRLKDAA